MTKQQKHWNITTNGSDESTMKVSSPTDKEPSRRSGSSSSSGRDEITESWSAAVSALNHDKYYNDIPPITTLTPSDEEARDVLVPNDGGEEEEEKKTETTTTTTTTMNHITTTTTTPPSPTKSIMSIPDLSSPKSSPFRQSLDEEAKAKDRQRSLEAERIANSKQLLRESMNSLSNQVFDPQLPPGESSVLTRPERNFLELLLETDGPGAAEACMTAHKTLMDGNLFWTMCGGAAGEVMAPGHGWATQSGSLHGSSMGSLAKRDDSVNATTTATNGSVGGDWVQDWVSRGSVDSKNSQESGGEKKKTEDGLGKEGTLQTTAAPTSAPATMKAHSSSNAQSSTTTSISSSTKEILRPYELQRKSSEARLSRLELRKRQSSGGLDNNRLFRAHEAGLVVTPGGSARRSLMRMGLPMEKGLYTNAAQPMNMPPIPDLSKSTTAGQDIVVGKGGNSGSSENEEEQQDPNVTVLSSAAQDNPTTTTNIIEPITFEKALAKMDERTIRRIEKEERAKQKKEATTSADNNNDNGDNLSVAAPSTAVFNTGGCISPFSMSILRRMFASKQFSFHRSSSSYSRFHSLLNTTTGTNESGLLMSATSAVTADLTTSDTTDSDTKRGGCGDNIFRPSPRSSRRPSSNEERLKNLLINAGFKDEHDDDDSVDPIMDADDDADIMSTTSGNTVAVLMKGGPSYRNVDMFRGESPDTKVEHDESTPKTINMKKSLVVGPNVKKANLSVQTTVGSLVSSLGSKSAPGSPDLDVKQSPSDELKVSPANSDVAGELPNLPQLLSQSERTTRPSQSAGMLSQSERSSRSRPKRSSTIGIIKSSSSATSPTRRGKYKRSVSWGHMVFDKEEIKAATAALARQDSTSSGLSVISFPNLGRAAPIRSDSISSNVSGVGSYPPPLCLGAPLRSEGSMASMASMLSAIPSLYRAHPVNSPRPSFAMPPMLMHAHSIRSLSQRTMDTAALDDDDDDDEGSLNSEKIVDAKPTLPKGAAWESPRLVKGNKPPLHGRNTSSSASGDDGTGEHPVFIRQASVNNYEGMGIEVEELPQLEESVDNARRYQSMVSVASLSDSMSMIDKSWRSAKSSSSKSRIGPPIKALDDSFIIKNIDFERHSSEILRSLSNEDLYSSHHLETIYGGSSKGSKVNNDHSSIARVFGDRLSENESWDLDSGIGVNSFPANVANAWGVLEDEYAEGYGAHNTLPFRILGTSASDKDCHPHVLSPPLMESLQNFFPPTISETSFWLKYSLVRDGASLPSLLRNVRGTKHTLIAIETVEGEVFGSFTSSPWRKNWNYYGNGEAFLWRMRRTRSEKDAQFSVLDQAKLESELDVFYWTGRNDLVQYCTHDMIAVGGGTFQDDVRDDVTDSDEQRELPPQNPVFTKADKGGFGLAIDSELLRGTSSPCGTFQSPPLSKSHANGSPFEILNIEVWTMTPCGNVAEAENLEMKTLFLEKYNRE
ncbi:hypothetical protein ACHAXR_011041 [Thalassiosira sp. AJA248-18]